MAFGDDSRFGVHSGPQNTTIDDYRDLWVRCEQLGFDWVSDFDHFLPIMTDPTGPQFEGLALLAAMAERGADVLFTPAWRHPANSPSCASWHLVIAFESAS